MASNYLVPVRQAPMANPGPPPTHAIRPPPGPAPIPPPTLVQQQQQQTYCSVPSMMPVSASPNITYGSLYPSRPVGGTVGGYMAYNVSMGGQPMYQQGQPVGQVIGREQPSSTPFNQMVSGNPMEQQRQRHLSGPSAYNSTYMQKQVESYAPPPPPSPSPNNYAPSQSPSPGNYAPPSSPSPGNYAPSPSPSPGNYAPPTPPSPGPSGYAPATSPSPGPAQRERHLSQPSMPYQQHHGGQTVSRMSTTYLGSSHPYGTGMKNLTMSASAPLEQQLGYKRDSSFPLTDIEKGKINSEFKHALETADGPLEVTDNTMLRIFMLLPETIRRGIKRMGGLKTYLEQSQAFEVRGDLVGLPGQIKRTPVTIQPPPGRYQPRKHGHLSGEAAEFIPTGQRSRSASTSSSCSTSSNMQQGMPSNQRSTTTGSKGFVSSGFGSAPTATNKQGFSSMPTFGTRQASVTDNVKDLQRTAAPNKEARRDSEEKKDNNVFTLVKDEPVADDLWELDSFLTEAYGGGYYQDYLALSKELEKKSSQATQQSPGSQAKGHNSSSQDSFKSNQPSMQSPDSAKDTMNASVSASSGTSTSSSTVVGSSQHETKYSGNTGQVQDSDAVQTIHNTTSTVKPLQDACMKFSRDQTGPKVDELPKNLPLAEENTCKADVIDPNKFERKAATTFAAKLLEAASVHSESTCERVDGRTTVPVKNIDASGPSDGGKGIRLENAKEEELTGIIDTVQEAACGTTAGDIVDEERRADPTVDKDDISESSWSTISDDSPQRLSKIEMVDQYVDQAIAKEMLSVMGSTKKAAKLSKSNLSDAEGKTGSDATCSDGEGVKSAKKKVRCAAVFNVAQESWEETNAEEENEKSLVDSGGDANSSGIAAVEKTVGVRLSIDNLSPRASGDADSEHSDVKVEGLDKEDASGDKAIEDVDLGQKKEGKLDAESTADLDGDIVEKTDSEEVVEMQIVDEKTDAAEDGKKVEKPESEEDAIRKPDAEEELVVKLLDSETEVVEKWDADDNSVAETDFTAVMSDTKTGGGVSQDTTLTDADADGINTHITSKSVQDISQIAERTDEVEKKVAANCNTQDTFREHPSCPVHEEVIMEQKVPEVDVKEYLASAAAKKDHSTISVGVNTDQVKMAHKGIVTSKVPKMSRVTNTVAVTTMTRCVGTFEDLEKSYYQKNIELENQIRLLEENLENERDKSTLQKHSFQVEIRTLNDRLETLTQKKNEVEDLLKIRKRQQVTEMRKTTAEWRDTDARYSAQKSKVTALEKENSCITRELSSVTRELFDLQAIMEAETIRNRKHSVDEATSTEELERAQLQMERQMELEKRERANVLLERARQAELQILKMQLENCQKCLCKVQEQGQQTYSIYANSPQISTHEKLYVNRQWSGYQNLIQEATEKLLVDYESNELLLKEGAALAELKQLHVSRLEPFTPRTGGPALGSRRAPSNPSSGFTLGTSQQANDTGSGSSITLSDTSAPDAGLDELKDMTSRLLQPNMDLSKPSPSPSMPNLAGAAPLFSMGSLDDQQPSSMHHPYSRQSREDRLRCIQRRLGLNPDTGKPFASRSNTRGTATVSDSTAPSSVQTSEFTATATASTKATAAARNPLLGSSAFNFAMKQRSLAAQNKSRQQNLTPPLSLANTYKKRSQSSSSSEDTTASTPQVPVPLMGMPPSLYQDYLSNVTPRSRSLSSPLRSVASQPEVVSTHFSHPETIPTHATESNTVLPEYSNLESHIVEETRDYEQSTMDFQYQGVDSVNETSGGERAGSTSTILRESEMPSLQTPSEAASYHQTEIYQSESEYYSSPEKVDREYQSQEQYFQEQHEEQQSSQEEAGQSESQHDKSVNEEWEITYTFTEDQSAAALETEGPYMQLDPVETEPTRESVNTPPSIETLSQDASQPEELQNPETTTLDNGPQFPKSEAIQATRSKSPANDDLGQRWDDLPHQLKSRVVPRMTRSGGVTLKAVGKSRSQETGVKSGAGGGNRKGSGSGVVSGASSVSGLEAIDDVEDGWTTVIGKKKKKVLDSVEQQQQPRQEAPKPLSKGSGSLDKIQAALARQFPNITRKEVMDTMKQVRIDHLGSLSGVSMAVLVKEASSHIKNTNPKYITRKPVKHDECDDICVICQDALRTKPGGSTHGTPAEIRMLDCGHIFHDECLKVWYDTRERTCPMCRCHTLLPEDFPRLI